VPPPAARTGAPRPNEDELAALERQYRAHRFDPRALILTIAPTLACNFGCDYCFQGQDKSNETMSPAVQDAIVALVERAAARIKVMGVAWYGGEPLIRRPVIEALSDRLIALCDARGIHYEASMVTNGYFLDAEAARSLHQRRVKQVQVTLDGAPHHHDARRVLLSGKPTFARIVDNLKAVVEAAPGDPRRPRRPGSGPLRRGGLRGPRRVGGHRGRAVRLPATAVLQATYQPGASPARRGHGAALARRAHLKASEEP
jgi:uncharacterized Fe-S cluster-containing radical SAM superfamily protein